MLGLRHRKQTSRVSSCLWGAGYPPNAPSVAQWRQRTPERFPVSGVAYTEFANSAYVKPSLMCHTSSELGGEPTYSVACMSGTVLGLAFEASTPVRDCLLYTSPSPRD